MTLKICLRCDWQGETKEPGCPNCGERPLYVVGAFPSEGAVARVGGDPEERSREVPSTAGIAPSETESPQSNPSPSPADTVEPSSRPPRPAVAFVLAALVLTVILGTWLNGDQERSAPAASTDAAVVDTPSSETSPSPTPEGVRSFEAPPTRRHEDIVNSVNGVPFSFSVPTSGERFGSISTYKSETGSQGAEAIIYWSTFPDGDYVDPYGNDADPCTRLLSPPVGPSVADLAGAVPTAPGTELVTGPSNVTVGGYRAKQVVLVVRKNVGCDPGYFYAWHDVFGGALWTTTPVGATMTVWIVEVDGTRLFIQAATTQQATSNLDQEIQQIVGSIRSTSPVPHRRPRHTVVRPRRAICEHHRGDWMVPFSFPRSGGGRRPPTI